jgi:hypothetical protein
MSYHHPLGGHFGRQIGEGGAGLFAAEPESWVGCDGRLGQRIGVDPVRLGMER